ncbi:hypothetical protein ISN75_10320 [Dyella marensis]|uniref:FliH/SctL family protein n=1 Tax=Dyella marensis TaxID=500610 RepID=UPI0031DCBE59
MSQDLTKGARRLSRHDIVQGQSRAFGERGETLASIMPEEADAEEHRFGFEQGYRDGLRQARTEFEAAAAQARTEFEQQAKTALDEAQQTLRVEHERLATVSDALTAALEEDRRWAESAAVEMAYAAMLRVLGDKAADRSLVAALCEQARRELGSEVVSVRVAEADAAALQALVPGIPVVADASLQAGSCVLESRRGRFDAGLDARTQQLRHALLAALHDGDAHA